MRSVVSVRMWAKSRAIVVPAEIHRQLRWYAKDVVSLEVQGDCLIVQKVKLPLSPTVTRVAEPETVAVETE